MNRLISFIVFLYLAISVYANFIQESAEWSKNLVNGDDQVHAKNSWTYNDCGSPDDIAILESLEVDPDPPQTGEKLTIKASGNITETIDEGAYADVVVKLGLIKILTKRFDICEELRKGDAELQCPIKPGHYDIQQSVDLPKEIPRAKFIVDAQAYNFDDKDILCTDIVIDFMH